MVIKKIKIKTIFKIKFLMKIITNNKKIDNKNCLTQTLHLVLTINSLLLLNSYGIHNKMRLILVRKTLLIYNFNNKKWYQKMQFKILALQIMQIKI